MPVNPGRTVGRVSIRVMPDTTRFRNDLKDKLRQIERTTKATVRVDNADVDRAAVRESIRRQMADFKGVAVDSNVQVLVESARVNREKVRAAIQRQLHEFGDLHVRLAPEITEKAKESFNHQVNEIVRHNSGKKINLDLNAHALGASATISRVSRPRVVELIVRVNKASATAALTSLAALSGARLAWNWMDSLLEKVRNLDKSLPVILNWTTGITSLVAALAGSVSGLVGIGQGLFSILPAFLVIPGLVQNAIGSAAVLIVALKNTKKELAELGPGFTNLGNIINTTFWERARQPLLDLVNGLMPQMENAFRELSSGVGDFTGALANGFAKALGNGRFESIFANVAEGWRILATGADDFAGAITSLSQIAARYTPRLASWFVRQANTFDNWLNAISNDGRLDAWMEQAIDSMYDLWDATTGIAGVFTGIWRAADQAGSGGLAGFADMMQRWEKVANGPEFQRGLSAIFRGSYVAMEAFGDAVGAIGDLIADWPDQVERFIGASGNFLGGLIEGAFEALNSSTFAFGLDDFSKGLDDALAGILPSLQPIADTFGGFLGLLGDLTANLLPTAAGVLADLMPSVDAVISAIRDSGVLEKLAGAVATVSDQLAPVVEGLVTAFSPTLVSALEAFAEAAPVFGESVANLGEMAIPFADALSGFWDGWSNVVGTISEGTNDWAWLWNDDAMNKLIDNATATGDWFGQMMQWARDFDAEFARVMGNVGLWASTTAASVAGVLGGIGQFVSDTFNNIVSLVTEPLSRMTGLIMSILIGFQTGNWNPFWGQLAGEAGSKGEATGTASMDGLVRGVGRGMGGVSSATRGVVEGGIMAQLRNAGGMLVGVGASMMQGLVSGIRSVAQSVANAAVSVVSGAVNAARGFLNINSPSRVTRDVLGKPWGEGVAKGILSQRRTIVKAGIAAIDPNGVPVPGINAATRRGTTAGAGGGNNISVTMPLLPGETPQEQRDNLIRELQLVT